ncbi:MAG: META domain-containing protein [Spirochaetaceae bacterium]|jgi:hypothetical protein|nr:META domain-containing protein [Spirochaetaceae bacterium]
MRSRVFFLRLFLFVLCAVPIFAKGGQEEEPAPPEDILPVEEEPLPPPVTPPPVREWVFEDILEKVWRLSAIKIGYGSIQLNRSAMKRAGMDDLYILQFKEEGINGKALFNYYFAPYVRHEGKEVAFRQIVGTRMANTTAVNVGGLGEEEYYWYLQRVTRWDIVDNRLHLSTGDSEIVIYFIE